MAEGIEEAVGRMQAEASMSNYEKLTEAEKSFHDALQGVSDEYGKFGDGSSGDGKDIFIQFVKAEDNEDLSKGVKCGNCSFYQGGKKCSIIAQSVEDGGRCRLINIAPGKVDY
jgi:hypothetical protein